MTEPGRPRHGTDKRRGRMHLAHRVGAGGKAFLLFKSLFKL